MTRLRIALAAVLVLAALGTASQATGAPSCAISFKPATTGNWSVGSNWDLGRIPADGEDVCIPAGSTATLATGTIRPGAMSIAGTLVWSGGTISGAGTTTIEAGGRIDHTAVTALAEGRVLDVQGTLELKTAGTSIGVAGVVAPAITVAPGGVVKRTATGAGAISLNAALLNAGTVRADNGPLELRGGSLGPSTGHFGPGAAGGKVRFVTGTWALAQGADLLGDVEIAGATVTIPQSVTVPAAGVNRLSSGTLGGLGTLDVTGALELTGGRMADAGRAHVAPGGTLVVNGTVSMTGGRRIENEGLVDVAGDRLLSDDLPAPPELLDNRPGATVRKTAGSATGVLGLPLRNDGTVESLSGVLKVEDGGATPDTGTFRGASRANRVLLGAGRTLDGGVALEGTVELGSLVGAISVVPGETLTGPPDLLRTGGDFSGNLRVTGTMTWSGGRQVGPGTTTVAPGATLRVDGLTPAGCASVQLADGHRLRNEGLVRFEPGGDLFASSPQRPRIENAGTIELDGGAADPCGSQTGILGDALVANTGTIEKLAGTSPAFVSGALDNDGTVATRAGDLQLEGDPAALQSGTFESTGAGSTLTLQEGLFALGPPAAVRGRTVVKAFAELAVTAGTTLPVPAGDRLELEGTLSGAGRLRVGGALEVRTFGEQAGPGTTQIVPGGTLTVPAGANATLTGDRALVNQGAATVAGRVSVGQGSAIVNEGTLTLSGTGKLDGPGAYGAGSSGLVHNVGTLTMAGAGEGEVAVPLDNDGAVVVEAGTLVARGLLNWGAGGSYEVAGTLVISAPLKANAARLVLDGPASAVVYPDTATAGTPRRDALASLARNAAGGALVLRGGRSLTVGGAFANQGVLELGAGSTLAATAFSQTAGAILRPEVTAGAVGKVAASGAAALGGRLDTPSPASVGGDTIVLTASAVSGGFAAVTGGYAAAVGAADFRLHPAAGLQRAVAAPDLAAPAPPAVAPAPARTRHCRVVRSWRLRLRWGFSSARAAWRTCRAPSR